MSASSTLPQLAIVPSVLTLDVTATGHDSASGSSSEVKV